MKPLILISALALALEVGAAGTVVGDFETDDDLAALRWASQGSSRIERASSYASHGSSALRFVSPAWRQGAPEWPAFEWTPAVRDWRPYDRLVIDLVNPQPERPHFALFVRILRRGHPMGLEPGITHPITQRGL